MFLVVSHWEALPGHEAQAEQAGAAVRDVLQRQPGVELVAAFWNGARITAVHGYRDAAAYTAVVDDPAGEFQKALDRTQMEQHARWIDSERGETMPG
ncbi:MAG TPA: hypothetical protein VGM37_12940 [Armatimonadota bacterium]|jgi:hypothetical protein